MFGQHGLHWQVHFIFKTLWNYKWLFNQWRSFCVLERMASDLLAPLCCDFSTAQFLWKRPDLSFNFRNNISSFTQNIVQEMNQNFKLLLSDVLSVVFMWLFKLFQFHFLLLFPNYVVVLPVPAQPEQQSELEVWSSVTGLHTVILHEPGPFLPHPKQCVCVCVCRLHCIGVRKESPAS